MYNPLKKYATHLFTTPLSNPISDNMSRLILTLTKHFFDIQLKHFKKNNLKSFVYNASL